MEQDFGQLLEALSSLEADEDWENQIATFVDQNCDLNNVEDEQLSLKEFKDKLKIKTKDVVSSFINKYIKRLREYKNVVDLQNDGILKLKSEIVEFQEENEQLYEKSLTLIVEIKRLEKYVGQSDILSSILRGEIHKQRRQNKILMNALEELYKGNEDLATKILSEPLEENALIYQTNTPDRFATSPDRRQASLGEDSLLDGLRRSAGYKGNASERGGRRNVFSIDGRHTLEGVLSSDYALSPEKPLVVNEDEEYIPEFDVQSERDVNVDIIGYTDDGNRASEKNGTLSLAQSYIEFLSPHPHKTPKRTKMTVPKLISLLDAEADREEESFRRTVNLMTSVLQSPARMHPEEFKFDLSRKLKRTSKWLIPPHRRSPQHSRFLKSSTIEKDQSGESDYIEVEDRIEEFIGEMKVKAKANTGVPLASMVKMPVSGLVGLVLDAFGVNKLKFFEKANK